MMISKKTEKIIVGWREYIKLTDISDHLVKAKIDTGAKTSALHAYEPKIIKINNKKYINFKFIPDCNKLNDFYIVEKEIIDKRKVKSSNGQIEERPIIYMSVLFPNMKLENVEFSITSRYMMRFQILIGRNAMSSLVVSPNESYLMKW